ncbi:rhomboid family intramembrane serine protease [Nocardia otitidiscaviarum]|uniref:Rhomboid family intramembrane serine protease n=1 Tax=Nocardia otitidiscaviarum TaxID=1823 RepID=A0A378YD04_9NOCA|nr:rhomboid family intramembrane serine protease [Nocardia otitidiscaviarum]MBF6135905.1 rhomboid family intramembrane serine protease [Nocardia otitidiscaviarum]MBF6178766.1 rhomboid family intramembrane serine protease [Nocardia otitidiscaviarum]MBF6483660.1 rhomboid family intramembrane serine protease [Nocardia otitidiscaviarum]MCP9621958.1 rhomboid family intramembrane serine protease [Nocardia otitidiscaviarum]QDP82560.1 rhomboid family intramembrane serine protease [Nocardia otitidiscav
MNPHPPAPSCYRHPDRPTGLACTRCGRSACPECLRSASVGQHCVDCVAQGQKDVRQVRTVGGATLSRNPVPFVTYALIAVNVVIYGITALEAGNLMDNRASSLFRAWRLVPAFVGDGEWFRVVGSGFLHYGLIHLLVNMLALYLLGPYCEVALGRTRFLAVYLASLLGGSAAVMALVDPLTATVGASGAIYGLFGAVAVIMLRTRQNMTQIAVLLAINLFISVSVPGISLWAHLGGLAAGTLSTAGILYLPRLLRARTQSTASAIGWGSVAAVVVLALVVSVLAAPTVIVIN